MKLDELRQLIEEALSYPYAWKKFEIEASPEQRHLFVRDRAAQIATALEHLLPRGAGTSGAEANCAFRVADGAAAFAIGQNAAFGKRPRAGEVVGVDDDGPLLVEFVSKYPQNMRDDLPKLFDLLACGHEGIEGVACDLCEAKKETL